MVSKEGRRGQPIPAKQFPVRVDQEGPFTQAFSHLDLEQIRAAILRSQNDPLRSAPLHFGQAWR